MLKNYLTIAIRSLSKHFTYSLINIVGLGLGLATCLLLTTWIRNELSYDRFHTNADRIYRASLEYSFSGQTSRTPVSPTALLPALQKNFPEVESGVRLYNATSYNPYIIRKDEKLFQENAFTYADSTFFDVFSYKLAKGDAKRALTEPKSVVITESIAQKYFGQEDPIGKSLQVNNRDEYTVTGVMEDAPKNSILSFDFIASFSSIEAAHQQIWWSANYETFLLLAPGTNVTMLANKTNEIVKKELSSELTNSNDYVVYNFIAIPDIYLRSDFNEQRVVSSINYIYGFGSIAFLILLIACINYINLATARAAERAKEVGVRKVVGALRKQLFVQFIGESFVITFLAFLLAFALSVVSLPMFNALTGKDFTSADIFDPSFLTGCLFALIAIAFFAGAYPAIAISGFRPVSVLKGNFKSSGRGIWLRKSLVVFQFSTSIILICGTLVIIKQINYLQGKRLGYDKENLVILPLDRKTDALYAQIRTELMRSGHVANVARAMESPTRIKGGYSINMEGLSDRGMLVTAMSADTSFVPTLGMEMAAGRNFNESDFHRYAADTIYSFILNESAIKELFLPKEKAIGTKVSLNGRHGEIVGIVKDFHFTSLHSTIGPLVLFNEEESNRAMFIRLTPGNPTESIASIKQICSTLIAHRPFEYEFLDQKYAALYSSEEKVEGISAVFATITIVIACLGLFGLVAFAAAQKTKEIGIRKVMGASATSIVVLISRDYTRLVLISIAIGLPTANWVINKWFLSYFAYRTTIGVWPFAIAGIGCMIMAFATSSYQAVKAASINPTKTLRME